MQIVVIGGGTWGTAFSCLLRDRGHDVTLACRDREQARAIRETGRNPRYLQEASLQGVEALPLDEAPLADYELVVLAIPSRAFAKVAASLPGNGPVLVDDSGLDEWHRSSLRRANRVLFVL